jgi:phosphatidylserine/phosphatidylglycerophosphate/cardiolipin synthase-like enzyme
VFRERWADPTPLTRNPLRRLHDRLDGEPARGRPLPPQLPDPPPCGGHAVQLLRTYPYRRRGYAFAPLGERSVARAYHKVLQRARGLIYLEDQYLWSPTVVSAFAQALAACPELRMIVVVPHHPDTDGAFGATPQVVGRVRALAALTHAGGGRVAAYGVENAEGTPVYVHAKLCVVDDVWAAVGSDNVSLRSWTFDSELSCAVLDPMPRSDGFARALRLALAREHLDRADGDDADLRDPASAFAAFARAARALDAWYAAGRKGARPAGRLRPYRPPVLPATTKAWAGAAYRTIFDPDGRPPALRERGGF